MIVQNNLKKKDACAHTGKYINKKKVRIHMYTHKHKEGREKEEEET